MRQRMTIRFNESGGAPYAVTLRLAPAVGCWRIADGLLMVNGNQADEAMSRQPMWYNFPLSNIKYWYVEDVGGAA